MKPTKDDLVWDFESPQPAPQDVHMRCNETREEREELERRRKAAAPPPTPTSTVAEQRAIAADPASSPEQKQRALDVLRVYAAAYAKAGEIYGEDCDPSWRHFEACMQVLREYGIFLGLEP